MTGTGQGMLTYVIFAIGEKRYALESDEVVELLRSGQVHSFPHSTPGLVGVLLHRSAVLPVWDVARVLVGPGGAPQKYFLVARCKFGGVEEWTAIPVCGECQMLRAEMASAQNLSPGFVRGVVTLDSEAIEVLDLELLAASFMCDVKLEPAVDTEVKRQ